MTSILERRDIQLGVTSVCSTCGAVYWTVEGHSCPVKNIARLIAAIYAAHHYCNMCGIEIPSAGLCAECTKLQEDLRRRPQ